MFTESIENPAQIFGTSLYLEEQNPLLSPLFHTELALNSNTSTLLDFEQTNHLDNINLSQNETHDSMTGMAGVSAISGLLPDLVIESISGAMSASLGQYLSFSYIITNKGNGLAASSVTRFYLSQDIFLDRTDFYLGLDTVTSLDAKMSRSESASIYFNSNINTNLGTYYLLAQADGYNFLAEANKTNNINYKLLQLTPVAKPDLVIQSLSVPSTVSIATQLDWSYIVANIGNSSAPASISKFYLSDDTILDSSDIYLGIDSVAAIDAGTSKIETVSAYLNDYLEIGTYYLIAQSDSYALVNESNENNNIFYQTLELTNAPKPDLLITTLSIPTTALISTQLNFSYTLSNAGHSQAGTNYTKFYFSNDTTLNESDLYLDSEFVANLPALSTRLEFMSLQLDNTLNSGIYYLLAVSDGDNFVIESEETNNIFYQTITITSPSNLYSSLSGYGLVNASAALAKVLGEHSFPDVPNLGGKEWDSDLMKVPEVWNQGYTGQDIIVAVLDTGVDRYHLDLSANIWCNDDEIGNNGIDDDENGYIDDIYGWNFLQQTNNTLDIKGHGTHIAGTIAGIRNNIGVTGVAYNAKIMPVKVLNDQGVGDWASVANGIRYAVDNGARVINLSLGGFFGTSELQSVVQYASEQGAVVVMAAGNSGGVTPQYPATYAKNWGLAVGSVNKSKRLAAWSNKAGNNANMAYFTAPGTGIYSTLPNDKYNSLSGTSMATSQISGVVALLLSADDSLTDSEIRQILTSTSRNNILLDVNSFNPTSSKTQVSLRDVIPSESTIKISSLKKETTTPKDSSTSSPTQLRYRQSAEMSLTELNPMIALI